MAKSAGSARGVAGQPIAVQRERRAAERADGRAGVAQQPAAHRARARSAEQQPAAVASASAECSIEAGAAAKRAAAAERVAAGGASHAAWQHRRSEQQIFRIPVLQFAVTACRSSAMRTRDDCKLQNGIRKICLRVDFFSARLTTGDREIVVPFLRSHGQEVWPKKNNSKLVTPGMVPMGEGG